MLKQTIGIDIQQTLHWVCTYRLSKCLIGM